MSSDDRVDRRYWLEPNVEWSEEPDLIAIEVQRIQAYHVGVELLSLIEKGEYERFSSLGPFFSDLANESFELLT